MRCALAKSLLYTMRETSVSSDNRKMRYVMNEMRVLWMFGTRKICDTRERFSAKQENVCVHSDYEENDPASRNLIPWLERWFTLPALVSRANWYRVNRRLDKGRKNKLTFSWEWRNCAAWFQLESARAMCGLWMFRQLSNPAQPGLVSSPTLASLGRLWPGTGIRLRSATWKMKQQSLHIFI